VPFTRMGVGADGERESQSQERILEKVLHAMSFRERVRERPDCEGPTGSFTVRFAGFLIPSANRSCCFATEITTVEGVELTR
jgi:hypothetical protein